MNVTLYTNTSPINKVDKYLTEIITVTAVLKDGTDITDPVLTLSGATAAQIAACNYVYIPALARYYFVNEIDSLRNGLWRISCHVDVLMTYASQIRLQTAVIKRQENEWNLYLDDGTFKTYQNPHIVTKAFPSGFTTQNFVLAIAGS